MGSGKKCYTTGYRYYAGLHLVFCHGLDALLGIRVGEKWAWTGSVTGNTAIGINQPNLFGGESREGGVVGTVDACFGGPYQPRNDYLQSVLGTVPAFRGLFALIARRCMLSANNPYVKEWSILGCRTRIGWRDDLAGIFDDDGHLGMNPTHILLEALTNTSWGGLGYPLADIDLASFQTAANLLAAERFGLSLLWAKNSTIEDFIGIICDHIDAKVFFSHVTGLLKLKLIRNDYNLGALAVLNESNIIELVDFTAPSAGEAVNQVTVNWVDRENQPQAVTVQDIAGLARTDGQVNATTLEFVGIASASLAARAASRELQQLCMPIASATLLVNRTRSQLEPGDCFAFSWKPLGIENMIMRVDAVEIGELAESPLRITAVRDVYGLGAVALTTPEDSQWANPISDPAAARYRQVRELGWWQFVMEFGDTEAVLAELDDDSTLVQCYCGRPSPDAINYEMWARNAGASEWTLRDIDSFPWVGSLAVAVAPEVETVLHLVEPIDPIMVKPGQYAALEDELVGIVAVDEMAGTLTVNRGVLDTIPVAHPMGARLWCHQGLHGLDQTLRAVGETVEVRLLPSTAKGRLALTAAPTDTLATVGRMMRPYPPGNVKINGSRWPESIGAAAELVLSWAHRDRTMQTVTLNRQDDGDIGPETGVAYTLRIYGETGSLLRTIGLTGTGYTYALADERTDSGFQAPRLNTSLRIELESRRGSLISLNKWNLTVARAT
ncbi:phage tail protein [Desulfobulbus sp.]|uniref:phage tail protein n=1 Tax=Desulfobulbus sp. TaxID=895 RepID=UPI00286ECD7D|nr:phage tail protein [Desulfobulbus sp.]